MIGVPKYEKVTGPTALVLREFNLGKPVSFAYFFQRASISGKVFHSKEYRRAQKRNSFTVVFMAKDEIWVMARL
jgi:hypothetical protein